MGILLIIIAKESKVKCVWDVFFFTSFRGTSFLLAFCPQQIIELLAYALVLSGNHVFTSGAMGTNAATIRCGRQPTTGQHS